VDPSTGLNSIIGQLVKFVRTDHLTPLLNAYALREDSTFESFRPYALILLDINNFKRFNQQSHEVGDFVIREVALAIDVIAQSHAIQAYRHGGDEFILLPKSESDLSDVLKGLQSAFHPFHLKELGHRSDLEVTVSVGVATVESTDVTLELARSKAEAALSAAKALGKGGFSTHIHGPQTTAMASVSYRQTCRNCGNKIVIEMLASSPTSLPSLPKCPVCADGLREMGIG
jgi:diguanylate cyclase